MKGFRITADDIGACQSIDNAVEELIKKRIITDISVFVNSEQDTSWILNYKDNVNIGLHLTFTYNKPVNEETLRSVLCSGGRFAAPVKPQIPSNDSIAKSVDSYLCVFRKADIKVLTDEVLAQYNKFIDMFGIEPAFINVHHDLDKEPLLKRVLSNLFPENKSRFLKLEENNYRYLYQFLPENASFDEAMLIIYTMISNSLDYKHDHYDSEIEVVFHPALYSTELDYFSTYARQRELEYRILSTQKIKNLLLGEYSM